MNDKQKVIDKIKKVLALASDNPNENEAALAAERAQAMLAQHNLTMEDIFKSDKAEVEIIIDQESVTNSNPWFRRLAAAVAKLYFCEYYFTPFKQGKQSKNQHNFVGMRHNVEVAKHMFEYLHTTVNRLAQEGSRKVPPSEKSPYRTTFRVACTDRLRQRMMEMIDKARKGETKTETGDNLPVLASVYDQHEQRNIEHIQKHVGLLRVRKSKVSILHGQGLQDGDSAGKNISLATQIAGTGGGKRIGRRKK